MLNVSVPTLRDVAALAGVHPATASRALNPATKGMTSADTAERVLRAAEQLGYRPNAVARSLRTARSSSIGVVVPDLTNPLFPPIVRGIEAALAPHGYVLLIVNTDNNLTQEAQLVASLRARSIDGLILATARLSHPLLETLAAGDLPVVLVNRHQEGLPLPSVVPDDAAGIHLAVAHLAGLGHRRIAHIAGPQNTSTGVARLRAFRAAVREHAMDPDPRLVRQGGSWSEAEGARGLRDLLDSAAPFSAVIAGNDMLAVGCYDVLRERGLDSPADLSVVGFNDMPFVDKLQPALTTVHVPQHELGAEAARLLLGQMTDFRREERSELMPVELRVRQSTGPPSRQSPQENHRYVDLSLPEAPGAMDQVIELTVNGRHHEIRGGGDLPLLDVLRGELGLAGPRFGCGIGLCGACFVLVDGQPRSSCDLPAADVAGRDIVTVEGLAAGGRLHPVQQAFIDEQAAQCGYCTSGMVISAVALLRSGPAPTEDQVREAMDRNLCRCGAHGRVIRAVLRAAGQRA